MWHYIHQRPNTALEPRRRVLPGFSKSRPAVTTAFLVVCAFALIGCKWRSRSGSVPISDVTSTNLLNLVSDDSRGLPSGITLHIHGDLDGTAYVFAEDWETSKLSGAVESRIYHDWFQTNSVLHYVPESVRSGELTVDYTIH
jgi:hypothetical protein